MPKPTLLLTFAVLFASTAPAQVQVPDTPAGRLYKAWRAAQDSGDRAAIQQFIDKSMSWGRADAELNIGKQSGGYDLKKVEASTDTNLVVLAQERGPGKQFVRINLNSSADGAMPREAYKCRQVKRRLDARYGL